MWFALILLALSTAAPCPTEIHTVRQFMNGKVERVGTRQRWDNLKEFIRKEVDGQIVRIYGQGLITIVAQDPVCIREVH